MDAMLMLLQVVVGLGILNVWLIRRGQPTPWRGGQANSMKEEFEAYGLPTWSLGVVGFLKITCALLLIVGVWIPELTRPAAVVLAILMLGAVAMHIKVQDPIKKSLPAATLLILCLVVAFGSA